MKSVTLWCVLMVAVLTSGCRGDAPASSSACGGSQESVCRVTFRSLVESPDLFTGRTVRIEGYLGVSRKFFSIYASKESFDAGISDEVAIRIRGSLPVQENIFREHAYTWVSMVGVFRMREKTGTTNDVLIGEIFPPFEVHPLQVPGVDPQRGFDEVLIELEDLK
ncbi:hypothetical protein [Stenotrophomonas cyclobalanopsidis]|uniref:hypothetical protein n=1 Tax=Stenotrophomonas cyclobalanopsidis TaxID=2771362 RepID=UPI003460508D